MATSTKAKNTAWSKGVLITFWVLQILSLLASVAAFIVAAVVFTPDIYIYWRYYDHVNVYSTYYFISCILLSVFNLIAFGIVVWQIVAFHKKKLDAWTMLKTQIAISVYMTVCSILVILGVATNFVGGYKSIVDFITTIVGTFMFYATLIYSYVIYKRRKRAQTVKGDSYHNDQYGSNTELADWRAQPVDNERGQSAVSVV